MSTTWLTTPLLLLPLPLLSIGISDIADAVRLGTLSGGSIPLDIKLIGRGKSELYGLSLNVGLGVIPIGRRMSGVRLDTGGRMLLSTYGLVWPRKDVDVDEGCR